MYDFCCMENFLNPIMLKKKTSPFLSTGMAVKLDTLPVRVMSTPLAWTIVLKVLAKSFMGISPWLL